MSGECDWVPSDRGPRGGGYPPINFDSPLINLILYWQLAGVLLLLPISSCTETQSKGSCRGFGQANIYLNSTKNQYQTDRSRLEDTRGHILDREGGAVHEIMKLGIDLSKLLRIVCRGGQNWGRYLAKWKGGVC